MTNAIIQLETLFSQNLTGRLMIRASAGTGKTWTICSLVIRLITEENQSVSQMLIVTFTKAATAEMRHKIYQRLLESLTELSSLSPTDPFIIRLIEQLQKKGISTKIAIDRLKQAIYEFDQLFISTIHGFCKKLLSDFAFSAQRPFVLSIEENTASVIHQIASDFWRKRLLSLTHLSTTETLFYQRFIHDMGTLLPGSLTTFFSRHLAKPYLNVDQPETSDWESPACQYTEAFTDCLPLWEMYQDDIRVALQSAFDETVSKTYYQAKTVNRLFSDLTRLFARKDPAFIACEQMNHIDKDYIQSKLKKGKNLPDYRWLDAFDRFAKAAISLEEAYQRRFYALLYDFFCFAKEEILMNQQYQQALTQDDLLMLAQSALKMHPDFAQKTHQNYPVMIIDEHQDTDPVQADIFNSLYQADKRPSNALFVTVGDPKQAIYSFRGGDIYTYLQTNQPHHAEHAENAAEYTLSINFRSEKSMVDAINSLFGSPDAFMDRQIHFTPSDANITDCHWLDQNQPIKGLHATLLTRTGLEKPLSKTEAIEHCCDYVARRIAYLLSLGKKGQIVLFDPHKKPDQYENLQSKHIAILTRDNRQADRMQAALSRYQIAASVKSSGHIFESEEAIAIFYLLSAIRQPNKQSITLALSTLLFGFSGNELFDKMQDYQQYADFLDKFQLYQQYWHKEGISFALARCFAELQVYQVLMRYPKAERHLTNVRHLVEHLQKLQNSTQNPESVYQHYSRLLSDDQLVQGHDDTELRLESEDNLVQIMTIHKAKGLEFDWVFCPFLWTARLTNKEPNDYVPIFYHDDAHQARLKLNAEDRNDAYTRQHQDSQAEEIRIAYVALTRAKYYAEITSGAFNSLLQSPIGWLVHRQHHPERSSITQEEMMADWQALREKNKESININLVSIDDIDYQIPPFEISASSQHRVGVTASSLSFNLPRKKLAYDFSRLNSYLYVSVQENGHPAIQAEPTDPIFLIPEGKDFGNLMHKLLEQSSAFLPEKESILSLCEQYHIDPVHADAIGKMARRVLETPLDQDNFILNHIDARKKIAEMHFRFPVGNRHTQQGTDTKQIAELARQFRKPVSVITDTLYGYMNGIIDLITEYNGKYYLIDYKTHHLGNHISNYHPDLLKKIMDQQGYHLQYLIYLVAMRRWLRLRLPDYDDQTHLGGVYYVFTRGLSEDHPGHGIFFDLPDMTLIETIDHYFTGNESDDAHQ